MVKLPLHWSKINEIGSMWGIKIMLVIHSVFGRWGFRVFLYPVIVYYYVGQTSARRASNEYLQRLQPFIKLKQFRKLSTFKHFLMFGEVLIDKFLVWMNKIRLEDVVFETPRTIKRIDESKTGGVIVVSHLGNMEVCSALVQQLPDLKLTILGFTQHAVKFNALMNTASDTSSIELLQVTDMTPEVAIRLSERINGGGYIIIAGDRTPVTGNERVSNVSFLGERAPLPQGAFILAGLLKCPIYFMFCLKEQSRYHIYLELFSERLRFSRKERHSEVTSAVQLYARRLEYYCIKAPLQWFNFFSFWHAPISKEE